MEGICQLADGLVPVIRIDFCAFFNDSAQLAPAVLLHGRMVAGEHFVYKYAGCVNICAGVGSCQPELLRCCVHCCTDELGIVLASGFKAH